MNAASNILLGISAGLVLCGAVAAEDTKAGPTKLNCTDKEGCEVTCYRAGAVDVSRSIILERSGVVSVDYLSPGWLQITVSEQARGANNYSGVVRLADSASCWFARMEPTGR